MLKLKSAHLLSEALHSGSLVSLTDVSAQTESALEPPEGKVWRLFDGTLVTPYDPSFGYALTRRSQNKNVILSAAQLEFVLFVQGRGDKASGETAVTNNKTMPRTAEEAMRLAGTDAGEKIFPGESYMTATVNSARIFRCEEWLDAQQLKSQMSKPRKELLRQYETRKVKEAEKNNRAVVKLATKIQVQQLILQHPYPYDAHASPPTLAQLRTWLVKYAEAMRRSGDPVSYALED